MIVNPLKRIVSVAIMNTLRFDRPSPVHGGDNAPLEPPAVTVNNYETMCLETLSMTAAIRGCKQLLTSPWTHIAWLDLLDAFSGSTDGDIDRVVTLWVRACGPHLDADDAEALSAKLVSIGRGHGDSKSSLDAFFAKGDAHADVNKVRVDHVRRVLQAAREARTTTERVNRRGAPDTYRVENGITQDDLERVRDEHRAGYTQVMDGMVDMIGRSRASQDDGHRDAMSEFARHQAAAITQTAAENRAMLLAMHDRMFDVLKDNAAQAVQRMQSAVVAALPDNAADLTARATDGLKAINDLLELATKSAAALAKATAVGERQARTIEEASKQATTDLAAMQAILKDVDKAKQETTAAADAWRADVEAGRTDQATAMGELETVISSGLTRARQVLSDADAAVDSIVQAKSRVADARAQFEYSSPFQGNAPIGASDKSTILSREGMSSVSFSSPQQGARGLRDDRVPRPASGTPVATPPKAPIRDAGNVPIATPSTVSRWRSESRAFVQDELDRCAPAYLNRVAEQLGAQWSADKEDLIQNLLDVIGPADNTQNGASSDGVDTTQRTRIDTPDPDPESFGGRVGVETGELQRGPSQSRLAGRARGLPTNGRAGGMADTGGRLNTDLHARIDALGGGVGGIISALVGILADGLGCDDVATVSQWTVGDALDASIVLPLQAYAIRPAVTFETGTMVMAVRGEQTGVTLIGDTAVNIGEEATTGTGIVSTSSYFNPVIKTPILVKPWPDVYLHGLRCGGGCKFTDLSQYTFPQLPYNPRTGQAAGAFHGYFMITGAGKVRDDMVPILGDWAQFKDQTGGLEELGATPHITWLSSVTRHLYETCVDARNHAPPSPAEGGALGPFQSRVYSHCVVATRDVEYPVEHTVRGSTGIPRAGTGVRPGRGPFGPYPPPDAAQTLFSGIGSMRADQGSLPVSFVPHV
jgi:hypothetical protein